MTIETTQQKTFSFELVSPERRLIEGQARLAVIPGVEGDFGVLAGHAALVAALRPGVVTLHMADDEAPRKLFISGGFADVNAVHCAVLAEEAVRVEDLDRLSLETDLANWREDLAGEPDPVRRDVVRQRIVIASAKLAAIGGYSAAA